MKMQSLDVVDDNMAYIAKRWPECLTEAEDENGKLRKVIDFDKLRQVLSADAISDKQERYQFTWPDKRHAIRMANTPTNSTLRPVVNDETTPTGKDSKGNKYCSSGSVDFDNTQNLYIEGDNLEVLKLLRESYLGKVKMIYVDPPYNTGGDFVYRDNFIKKNSDYVDISGAYDAEGNQLVNEFDKNADSNGRFHTDWLNMIYPRLKVARDLLSEDGVIFISIDDHEVHNLRKVCDEVFGGRNLVSEIPWQSRASIQNDTDFSVNHEYILVYAKNRRIENRRLKESNKSVWYNRDSFVCSPLPLNPAKFDNPDNDPRGPWKADPLDAPQIRPNLTYPIMNPNTGEQYLPPRGRHWRMDRELYDRALKDGRILFGKTGESRPQLKVFYEKKKDFGTIDNSWFSADRVGTSTQGTKEQITLFGGFAPFDTPKPLSLINKLLRLSNLAPNSLILDFFSGSATTAHAVMQLNAEDGGNRKYIMVQLPETTDEKSEAHKAGYKNICEIGKERIRRAGKKIKEDHPEWKGDTGFRVLKVDTSNMEDVYYTPSKTVMQSLFADNIKADRTDKDLLFQVMMELGIPLSEKIKQTEIQGKTVWNVGCGFLVACFEPNVTEEAIATIAKLRPQYFVIADRSLANDDVADNLEQLFEEYSPATNRKIL